MSPLATESPGMKSSGKTVSRYHLKDLQFRLFLSSFLGNSARFSDFCNVARKYYFRCVARHNRGLSLPSFRLSFTPSKTSCSMVTTTSRSLDCIYRSFGLVDYNIQLSRKLDIRAVDIRVSRFKILIPDELPARHISKVAKIVPKSIVVILL